MIQFDIQSARRQRSRVQNNFPDSALVIGEDEPAFIEVTSVPEPEEHSALRFKLADVLKRTPTEVGKCEQVIIDEESTVAELLQAVRELRSRIKRLREESREKRRSYWAGLLVRNRSKKDRWIRSTAMAFRKAKWVKFPTGRFKEIHKKVYLKARPRYRRIRYRDPYNPLRFLTKTVYDPNYRPHVWRTLIVPVWNKHIVRPAGLVRIKTRIKTRVDVFDWPSIKAQYLDYKSKELTRLEAALAPLTDKLRAIEANISERLQVPHRMVTYTKCGLIPLSADEDYARRGLLREQDPTYLRVPAHRAVSELGYQSWHLIRSGVGNLFAGRSFSAITGYPLVCKASAFASSEAAALDHLNSEFRRFKAEYGDKSFAPRSSDQSIESNSIGIAKTRIGELKLIGSGSDADDEAAEAYAVSEVSNLRGAEDYVFNFVRSVGELKDSRETFSEGLAFLRWLNGYLKGSVRPNDLGLRSAERIIRATGRSGLALVAVYFTWKFGIEPTIQDVQTFLSREKSWLLTLRRHLHSVIKELEESGSSIYHCRMKARIDHPNEWPDKRVHVDVGKKGTRAVVTLLEYLYPDCVIASSVDSSDTLSTNLSQYRVRSDTPSMVHRVGGADLPTVNDLVSATLSGSSVTVRRSASVAATCETITEYASERLTPVGVTAAPSDHVHSFDVNQGGAWGSMGMAYGGDDDQQHLAAIKGDASRPTLEVPGFLMNQVTEVAFARYRVEGLLRFLELDSGSQGLTNLSALTDKLAAGFSEALDLVSEPLRALTSAPREPTAWARYVAKLDVVYVGWQLTPLSFVADWLLNTDSIVKRIAALQRTYTLPPPPSMDGTWVRKRVDLLAGRPAARLVAEKVYDRVMEWYGAYTLDHVVLGHRYRYRETDPWSDWQENEVTSAWKGSLLMTPKKVVRKYEFEYEIDSNIGFERSGLYRAVRGEAISGGWKTFLPRVRININAGKVVTLLGLLAQFLAGKAK